MNKIAPNNNLPATHFIEVWNNILIPIYQTKDWDNCVEIKSLEESLNETRSLSFLYTSAIFRIRENKLPTLHKF